MSSDNRAASFSLVIACHIPVVMTILWEKYQFQNIMPSGELTSVPFFARMGHNVMVFWLVIKLLFNNFDFTLLSC